jgi:hypothetical protein
MRRITRRVAGPIACVATSLALGSPTQAPVAAAPLVHAAIECHGCESCLGYEEYSVPSIATNPDTWWITFETFYCPQNPFNEPCGWGGCFADEDLQAMIERIQELVAVAETRALIALVKNNMERVLVVPERSAIQVLDCNGERVHGQVGVSELVLAELT